jgi:hypothetical protein
MFQVVNNKKWIFFSTELAVRTHKVNNIGGCLVSACMYIIKIHLKH